MPLVPKPCTQFEQAIATGVVPAARGTTVEVGNGLVHATQMNQVFAFDPISGETVVISDPATEAWLLDAGGGASLRLERRASELVLIQRLRNGDEAVLVEVHSTDS